MLRWVHRPSRLSALAAPALIAAAIGCLPATARATFHLNEISKVMTSFNGDATVQAVELKMLAAGENHVTGVSLVVYDPAGAPGATLGTFAADLPIGGAVAGGRILLATMKWKQKFGVTPDLQISPGLLTTDGQIAFQSATCVVNAVAYGAVSTFVGGNVTAAPPLPAMGAPVLIRVTDDAIFPACPMDENAGAKFQFVTASSANPVTFTNNSGVSASVFSIVTGVGETALAPTPMRAYPNPFRGSIHVESPAAGWTGVFDVHGSLVRVLDEGPAGAATYRGDWDGRDGRGRPVPAGVYFIRFGRGTGARIARVALLR